MLIWLASFPRSGNTMIRILLHKVYGRQSLSLYDECPGEDDPANVFAPIFRVCGSAGQAGPLDELRRRPDVCFVKTHGLPADDSPAVYVVRDGRDALVSYAHFIRTYEPPDSHGASFEDLLAMLIGSTGHFGGWSGNVREWRARRAPTVWLRYEDLVRRPLELLDEALDRLHTGVRRANHGTVAFDDLHARWPDFFRKGKSGSWRQEMNPALQRLFWEHHHEAMFACGYSREATAAA